MARILLVEDDAELRTTLVEALHLLHHDVEAVDRPEGALGFLGIRSYDILMTGNNLMRGKTHIDGVALARSVREHSHDLPILLMSGTAEKDIRAENPDYDHLGLRFIAKPASIATLRSQIAAALNQRVGDKVNLDAGRGVQFP